MENPRTAGKPGFCAPGAHQTVQVSRRLIRRLGYAWSRSSAEATTAVIAGAVPGRSGRRSRDNTLYEREVVNVFRHKSSARSFCASSSAEERNRVKGRPRPGASGPLTRRRVQYAGEGWRARVIALASLASLDAYLPRQHLLQFEVCVLWSETGHRARKTPVSHQPSIRWRVASLILYARYAGISPGACPI
jgi:hypothetical protein